MELQLIGLPVWKHRETSKSARRSITIAAGSFTQNVALALEV
jgi:hypothetical protein